MADFDQADYYRKNKPRLKEYKRRYYQKNVARWRQKRIEKFGITVSDYEAMLRDQNYRCILCGSEEWECRDDVLAIDHDHKTGKVRGLLCNSCNLGLGHFRDNPDLLERAQNYLLDSRR
jgi:hypothetical protein